MLTTLAYIGPGAGIALLGSFMAVLAALAAAFMAIMTWPVRRMWRALRGKQALKKAKVRRVVIVGLDGLEPSLVDEYLKEGLLPNLAKLREQGCYSKLATTYPPLSPVAWSSFSTGTNPGKHNIFDFLAQNRAVYKPIISSVRIEEPRRTLKLGKFVIPLSSPTIKPLRKSKPFWSVLGEAGIFSAVLRVPITFPPDRFHGVQLSAMCVPDLLGTQGTFSLYAEEGETGRTTDGDVGGQRLRVTRNGRGVVGEFTGPPNPLHTAKDDLRTPFRVLPGDDGKATLQVDGEKIELQSGTYSDWVHVPFRAAPGVTIHGVCRVLLKESQPFEMYCTPMQIDPEHPVMPISHPKVYSMYLAKSQGTYATLGLAEDTWSLSEGAIAEDEFLRQAYDIHAEREAMLMDSLERVRRGAVICVFDAPDRIQHMFWRFIDDGHPALGGRENTHPEAIRAMYQRMDETVGKVLEKLDDDTALYVLSDHGFQPFRRGVDLNAWLRAEGYLQLKDDAATSTRTYLSDVDWTRTKAFAIGLAGIYVNQQGREAQGIVARGEETKQLVEELRGKLTGLRDVAGGEIAIHEAVAREKVYHGSYVDAAPDLIVGYNIGYRVSWDAAVGKCGEHIFSDNTKAWSGDHCIHPDLVPGVLFSNLKLRTEAARIVDLAPTTLDLLGVDTPRYMDGQSLLCEESSVSASA